eukprot:scaffold135640_cov17-Prasinocladus_malaysianus.AAC.2
MNIQSALCLTYTHNTPYKAAELCALNSRALLDGAQVEAEALEELLGDMVEGRVGQEHFTAGSEDGAADEDSAGPFASLGLDELFTVRKPQNEQLCQSLVIKFGEALTDNAR